jgi:L-ascorbate metabolism protein UlaG (beta-lactamase superfamily)
MHLSPLFRVAAVLGVIVLGSSCAMQGSSPKKGRTSAVPTPRPAASTKPATPTPSPTPPASPTPTPTPEVSASPAVPAQGVTVRWYGHAFMYLTSAAGVRVAIDPFAEGRIKYPFPQRLPADVVLVTNESEEHAGGDRLFGNPPVFRSITAIGLNKGNGFLFRGIQTYRSADHGPAGSSNTCFTFDMDGIRFAHLGALGHTLNSKEKRDLGHADVVFLPVGIKDVTVKEWLKIAEDTQAKVIVPMVYETPKSGVDLRSLDDFLAGQTNVKKIDASEFNVSLSTLPAQPMIYVLTPP